MKTGKMKSDWDERARRDARYFIAITQHRTEEEFDRSGARDAELFFRDAPELLQPTKTVLDLGCGVGRMDRHVAPRVGTLLGVDASGEMVRLATQRLAGVANVRFLENDGWSLVDVADESIDLVFSHIVFQHLPRPVTSSYFREVFRVLKRGGRFLFQVPEAVGEPPPEPDDDDTFTPRYFREASVRAELEAAGFTWEGCRRHPTPAAIPPSVHLQPRVRRPPA